MKAFYTIFLIISSFSLSLQLFEEFFLTSMYSIPFHLRLQMEPPKISLFRRYDNHFNISPNQLPHELQNTLIPVLHHDTAGIASGKISEIAETILLATGIGHQTVRHEHWEFNIMDGIGRLFVFRVNAQIFNYDVHVTGGVTEIVQTIPKVVDIQEKCSNTGDRRYLLFGPRSRECRKIFTERGLNHDEVMTVHDVLIRAIPSALHMLQ
jgi:hypothetical protein